MSRNRPRRVLIADGSPEVRQSLRTILVEAGHEVVGEAKSCLEAIQLYQVLEPDLITIGMDLAECQGITVLRALKKIDPNARIIMCPALGQKNEVVHAIQAGALDFIIKPFLPNRVIESVEKHAA